MNDYSIDELIQVIAQGAEILFEYGNEKYSISQTDEQVHLTKHGEWENTQSFRNGRELVEKAVVDNASFTDLWEMFDIKMWL